MPHIQIPKRITAFLIACILLLSCTAYASEQKHEFAGANTPEEAVQHYLEGLAKQDLYTMISAFAIETYVQEYDIAALLERLGAYMPTSTIHYPNANDLFTAINVESRKAEVVHMITLQQNAMLLPELAADRPLVLSDEKSPDAADFIKDMENALQKASPTDESGLIAFIAPTDMSDLYANERNMENMARRAAICGADELQSVIAVFTYGENTFAMCCDVIRYGDMWFMEGMPGNIGTLLNISASLAGTVPVDLLDLLR